MVCETELSFLCDVFLKNHVSVTLVEESELGKALFAQSLASALGGRSVAFSLPSRFAHDTVYKFVDPYGCCYRFLRLPQKGEMLLIGPYLSALPLAQRVMEIAEENGVSPSQQRYVHEYYAALSVLAEDNPLWSVFYTFCERAFGGRHFSVKTIESTVESLTPTPISPAMREATADDTLIGIKAMERRYAFENEMIRAVERGQAHVEERFSNVFYNQFFEQRVADPLRNAKNYAVIMNTLLRKAAERGGVHPVYLDRISSDFAHRIEGAIASSEIPGLMGEMFRSYCRLVREHSLEKYSPLVQKTILMIDADLSAEISPRALAKAQNVTPAYLSGVFSREMGQTLSGYICGRRIEHAQRLLATTTLQIQTVALHCGILDLQYFSKVFKKHTGKSPSEYRAETKRAKREK